MKFLTYPNPNLTQIHFPKIFSKKVPRKAHIYVILVFAQMVQNKFQKSAKKSSYMHYFGFLFLLLYPYLSYKGIS